MTPTNDKLVKNAFEYTPTKLGTEIEKLANGGTYNLKKMYNLFLKNTFWIPANKEEGGYYPILSVQKNGDINFVLFEKRKSMQSWHHNNKQKVSDEIFAVQVTGKDFINNIYAREDGKYDIYVHFGKKTFLVFPQKMMVHI